MARKIDIQKFMNFIMKQEHKRDVLSNWKLNVPFNFEDYCEEVYEDAKLSDVFDKYSLPPGCHEAVNEHGCSCKVAKHNASGTSFEVSDDCPLHGKDSHLKG